MGPIKKASKLENGSLFGDNYRGPLPSVNTNFMTLIVSFLKNLGPSKYLLTNNKESNLTINRFKVSQEFTSHFVWPIIETLQD
jgi:hypothetical protein